MADDVFNTYIQEINNAYLRGDSTEHTHRPALKTLIEGLAKKVTATNEPKRTECGAPDFIVSRKIPSFDQKIGYIECKDIGTNLKEAAKADAPGEERVFINKDQYFEGVNPKAWEFCIGGYQVCEKWLKDRRGRELSYDDIRHYQKVVVALAETIRLMHEPCLSEMFD